MGPRSSAIVGGTTSMHRDLELALAQLKGTEDCLLLPTGKQCFQPTVAMLQLSMSHIAAGTVFTSFCGVCYYAGFAANMAVVTALSSIGSNVAILSDELNHASIIDGARLAYRGSSSAVGSAAPSIGRTSLHIYRHNDMQHLEQVCLSECSALHRTRYNQANQAVMCRC
jgi:8-amino-7-oxononanoate synthase